MLEREKKRATTNDKARKVKENTKQTNSSRKFQRSGVWRYLMTFTGDGNPNVLTPSPNQRNLRLRQTGDLRGDGLHRCPNKYTRITTLDSQLTREMIKPLLELPSGECRA
nr:hypothetical protein BgiMline_016205 [Biomphalaria glabrata]